LKLDLSASLDDPGMRKNFLGEEIEKEGRKGWHFRLMVLLYMK